MKKRTIQISIIIVALAIFIIIFLKYSPNIENTNIKKATITSIQKPTEDKELTKLQINEIITFINSAEKTRKIGIAKGWQYKIIIERNNFNTEITLNGDQLQIDNSTYTSKNITENLKNYIDGG